MITREEKNETHLIPECVQIPDRVDLQRRMHATARCSLEIAKDIIAEPLYDVHVRIRSGDALLHAQIQSARAVKNQRQMTYRQRPTARRDSLEKVHRRILTLPRILATTCRRGLSERAPDPLERDGGRCALAIGADAPECLDDVCSGLARRCDFRDLQLATDVLDWRVLERLDVSRAQCEIGHDHSCDEAPDRVVCFKDVAICTRADRGGDEAERLGHQLFRALGEMGR